MESHSQDQLRHPTKTLRDNPSRDLRWHWTMIFLLKFGPFCQFHVGSLEICKLPQLIPLAKPNLSLHWAGSEHSSQDVWRQSQHIIIAKRSKVYMKKLELGCCDASALDIGSYTAMTLMQHRRNKPLARTPPWSAQYLARECRKTVAGARMQRMHRMHRPQRANTWCSQRSKDRIPDFPKSTRPWHLPAATASWSIRV